MSRPTSDFGVLFDIDDTLVDFAGAARAALLDVAAFFEVRAAAGSDVQPGRAGEDVDGGTAEQVLRCWDVVSEREYGRFLAGELNFDDMRVARMTEVVREMDPTGALGLDPVELELLRNESIFTHYRVYQDVPAALERLRSAGVGVGVVSNSDGDYQRRKLVAAGLDDLISGGVFSGDLGVSKPDPEIFLAGAESLGLSPKRVVYVGDRWATDAVGALRAGLSAIWLNRTGAQRPAGAPELLESVPRGTVRLAELADLDPLDAGLARGLLPL